MRDGDLGKSAHFFQERFSDLEKKVVEVIEKIDSSENKGSFLMKLIHLKDQFYLDMKVVKQVVQIITITHQLVVELNLEMVQPEVGVEIIHMVKQLL